MRQSLDSQRGFPYRRRLYAARHRRRSLWVRLARPFLGALIVVGSPAALTAWVLTSPEFTVREIRVSGADRVPSEWAMRSLVELQGASVFEITVTEIERRLLDHPWLAEVVVRKRLPDEIHVSLVERQPVALFNLQGELHFVDEDGEVITPFDPATGPANLVVLSGVETPAAVVNGLEVAARFESVEPLWAAELSEIELLNETDLRLHTSALPFPLVVSADRLEQGIRSLRDQLPRLEAHLEGVATVDLRFERYIVVQPVKER